MSRRTLRLVVAGVLVLVVALLTVPTAQGRTAAAADAHISGTVTRLASPAGYNASATAVRLGDDGEFHTWASAYVDSDGHYDIGGLDAGTYRVHFSTDNVYIAGEWWDGAASSDSAQDVALSPGEQVTGIDGRLLPPGTISGQVTNSDGVGVQGIEVWALPIGPSTGPWSRTVTGPYGRYQLPLLDSADYELRFSNNGYKYLDRYWPDSLDPEGAEPVPVHGDDVTGVDVTLSTGAHLTGQVLSESGEAAPYEALPNNVIVYQLVDGDWEAIKAIHTDVDGHYDVGGLRAGTYQLQFVGFGDFAGRWYDTYDRDAAVPLVVAEEQTRDDLDVTLREGGHLTGRMTDSYGDPEVHGLAYVMSLDSGVNQPATGAPHQPSSESDGVWRADGLIPGRYKVYFVAPQASQLEWWEHAADQEHATVITVTERQVVGGIDVAFPTTRALLNTERPTISGEPRIGSVLHADPGRWDNPPTDFAYRWLRDGVTIPGANRADLLLGADDLGHRIAVHVTASDAAHRPGTAQSDPTDVVAPAPRNVAPPTVRGRPVVGGVLHGDPGTWEGASDLAYQWYVDGRSIPGATTSSFAVPAAVVGHRLSLRVSPSGPDQAAAAADSEPTAPVVRGTLAPRAAAEVTGRPRVGSVLVVRPGTWRTAGVHTTYQWIVDGRRVAGATAARFRPRPRDLGRHVQVRITSRAPGYVTDTHLLRVPGVVRRSDP